MNRDPVRVSCASWGEFEPIRDGEETAGVEEADMRNRHNLQILLTFSGLHNV